MPGRRRSHDEELRHEAEEIAIPDSDIVAGPVPGLGPVIDGTENVGKKALPGSSDGEEPVSPAASPNAVPG
jgi:hypothetical protein